MVEELFPANEIERIASLRAARILDTNKDERFDRIARLAAIACSAPTALVTFVDETRAWRKAAYGPVPAESTRALAFCAHTILQNNVFIVNDPLLNPKFKNCPLANMSTGIRFYAGAPIIDRSGYIVGALSVVDVVPRQLGDAQIETLELLAMQVVSLVELNQATTELEEARTTVEQATLQLRLAGHEVLHQAKLAYQQSIEGAGVAAAEMDTAIAAPLRLIEDNVLFLGSAFTDLRRFLDSQLENNEQANAASGSPVAYDPQKASANLEMRYLLQQIPAAIEQSVGGVGRVMRVSEQLCDLKRRILQISESLQNAA